LVATRVDLTKGIDSDRIEQLSSEIDERLRGVVGDVTEVFVDPTAGRASQPAENSSPERKGPVTAS
jgi:hypothetical protein